MQIDLNANTVIAALSILVTIITLIRYYNKGHKWFFQKDDKETSQDKEIQSIKDEQEILTKGLLACLKGLQQQGCNGPVTKGIKEIEDYLNEKAHD